MDPNRAGDATPEHPGGPSRLRPPGSVAAVAVGSDGRIFVADRAQHRVHVVHPDGSVELIAGNKLQGSGAGRAALVLPYLIALEIACFAMRTWRRYPRLHRIAPQVAVGGRLQPEDVPADVSFVVDLTSEFTEPAAIRRLPGYRCLPVLDGACPPDEDAFCALLDEVAGARGPVIFHCESGLGRAPTAAALWMVRAGMAPDAATALERIRRARPMVRPTSVDLDFIARVEPRLRAAGAPGRTGTEMDGDRRKMG